MPKNPHKLAQDFAEIARALASAKAIWAIVALVAILALASACALDTDRLSQKRAEIQTMCKGAMTPHLRTLCARYGIDTEPSPEVQ